MIRSGRPLGPAAAPWIKTAHSLAQALEREPVAHSAGIVRPGRIEEPPVLWKHARAAVHGRNTEERGHQHGVHLVHEPRGPRRRRTRDDVEHSAMVRRRRYASEPSPLAASGEYLRFMPVGL